MDFAKGFISILILIISSVGIIVYFFCDVLPSAKDMIQIKIAPKVYLIEKANELIKK